MKQIEDLSISSEQIQALKDIKRRLYNEFKIDELVLYGSVARNQPDDESDIDLLVLTTKPLTRFERHQITDVVFEINLQYGTNFSTLVLDSGSWQAGPISVLPLRDEIFKDGIML
jgi:predicted nucleotidyltransferase